MAFITRADFAIWRRVGGVSWVCAPRDHKIGARDADVDSVYEEISKYLLETLHTKYSFMEHLKVSQPWAQLCDCPLC